MADEREIDRILRSFCGNDPGRSVAFRSHYPGQAAISIKGDAARPAASVMKIALAMALHQLASQGRIDLDAMVPISQFPPTRYVSILAGFEPDRLLSVREICRLALITSDNPLTVHLQALASFEAVNGLMADLGCGPPCRMAAGFSEDELGERNRANVLTADASARLLHAIWTEPVYADLALALRNNLRNNRIPARLPEHLTVMHKTGSLNGVVNDAAIIFDDAVAFTLVFLCDGQADTIATSSDIAACALEVYDCLKDQNPARPGR